MRLILASSSPRRDELLRAAGFQFETLPVDLDERPRPGESPREYVRRVAMEKSAHALEIAPALAPARERPAPQDGPLVVIAADTAVVIDGEILGKPRDDADAGAMLRRLSGRRHLVMTGVSIRTAEVELGGVETTAVECAALSNSDVNWYVRSGEGRDKAGAYAIQGLASRFMTSIEGSYSNVVGLPVAVIYQLLKQITAVASDR